MKNVLNKVLPAPLKTALAAIGNRFLDYYAVTSYSQEGEDLILRRIFGERKNGFYVDVGAHHPRRFSNTCYFYRCGWRGINIEPNPEAMRIFQSDRRRDINLQLGVSDVPGTLTYYLFNDPALNTCDEALVMWRLENTPYKLIRKVDVRVERLDDILDRSLPSGQNIDFLSIDVEGFDLKVLQSNDWQRFRPACVLVEAIGASLDDTLRGEVFRFMDSQGYVLFAKLYNSLIFRDGQSVLVSVGSQAAK